jgi:steroid delta-isomerase-like uncharacterized protein
MKYVFLIAINACCIVGASQTKKAATNTKLINALFKAMNQHDSIAIAGFFADSATLESPNWEGTQKGKQAVTTVYSRYFKGTPDLTFNVANMVACDTVVVVEYTFAGQFSNPEGSSPAYMKDKKYSLKGITRYNIHGGKISAAVSYFDQVAFLRQVGFFDQK